MSKSVVKNDERTQLLRHSHVDEERQPLGCPDAELFTASEGGKQLLARTPLPWGQVMIILLLSASQPLVFELIFPFVNQMILHIGVVDDPEQVGFYSGLIESIFACMSFLAIMPCSYLSDRFGRKPVILVGIFGLGLSTFFFGLSRSYWFMIVTRCLGGALGGSWSAIKIMLAELTDKTNQGQAFSSLSIAYKTGQLLGQPIGGLLSHPERRWALFQHPFWYKYPYALPCFVAASFAILSVTIGYFWLQETLPSKRAPQRIPQNYGSTDPTNTELNGSNANLTQSSDSRTKGPTDVIRRPLLRAILTPSLISLLVNIFIMTLVCECVFVLYPLFAFTPVQSGGLGLSELVIGTHMAIRSTINVACMFTYAPIERVLGPVKFYQLAMFIWPLSFTSLPLLNYLARLGDQSTWFFNALLLGYFFIWSMASMTYTGSGIMVVNAAPTPEAVATINGVSQMTIALAQAIAPAFVTSLFAFSISSDIAGGNLIYVILLILTCGAATHSLTLQEPTHDWRKDREEVSD